MSVEKLVEAAKENNFSEFQKTFMEEFSHVDLAEAYRLRDELAEQEIAETSVDYTTKTDAYTALINSGVLELFDKKDIDPDGEVVKWMWDNDKSPEEAAEHFGVE